MKNVDLLARLVQRYSTVVQTLSDEYGDDNVSVQEGQFGAAWLRVNMHDGLIVTLGDDADGLITVRPFDQTDSWKCDVCDSNGVLIVQVSDADEENPDDALDAVKYAHRYAQETVARRAARNV